MLAAEAHVRSPGCRGPRSAVTGGIHGFGLGHRTANIPSTFPRHHTAIPPSPFSRHPSGISPAFRSQSNVIISPPFRIGSVRHFAEMWSRCEVLQWHFAKSEADVIWGRRRGPTGDHCSVFGPTLGHGAQLAVTDRRVGAGCIRLEVRMHFARRRGGDRHT